MGQKRSVEEGHGVSELLIPSVPAVGVATRHDFSSTNLIGPTASQSMPQQRGSHFEWYSEILEPGSKGVAEIVKVEIIHFRLTAQSLPKRAGCRRIPSTFDEFTPNNDPYWERNLGAFDHNGQLSSACRIEMADGRSRILIDQSYGLVLNGRAASQCTL